jgi:hypothetical protein
MAKPMPADQLHFYDEFLSKEIEGSYTYDGKAVHVRSELCGARTAPTRFDGCFFDRNAVHLFAQKVLSELARDAEKAEKKDSAESHSYKKAA